MLETDLFIDLGTGAGAESTLSWTATNATSISIAGTDGSSYTELGDTGTQVVSPEDNTDYTCTVTGPEETVTRTVTIRINPPTADLP